MLLVSNMAQLYVYMHVYICVQVHHMRVEARGQCQVVFQSLSTLFWVTGCLTECQAHWFD